MNLRKLVRKFRDRKRGRGFEGELVLKIKFDKRRVRRFFNEDALGRAIGRRYSDCSKDRVRIFSVGDGGEVGWFYVLLV